MNIIGDIKGKNCILIDDMIDTAGTICNAVEALFNLGAKSVSACATHAVLSGPAIERLEKSSLEEVILLDTILLGEDKILDKFKILSVAPLFAEVMIRIHRNDSVSKMFD